MESLIKQMRLRFSGFGQDEQQGGSNSIERRLPPQRTQSFKGERRNTPPSWFRRQYSGQMNQYNEPSDGGEFATVIAAAAFAINSIEEEEFRNQRKMNEGLESAFRTNKSRKDSRVGFEDTGRVSRQYSYKDTKDDKKTPGEGSHEILEVTMQEDIDIDHRMSEKVSSKAPIMKKAPTFGDPSMYLTGNMKSGMTEGVAIDQRMPEKIATRSPSIKKATSFGERSPNPTGNTRVGTTTVDTRPNGRRTLSTAGEGRAISGMAETQAKAWEQAELAKIKKRYEKTNATILSWEKEKKVNARRRLDKIESDLEKRRAHALQHYRTQISRIDQVAGGAKELAEERRRNEVNKTKEKAKKIRTTGKAPVTCFGF